MADAVLVIHLTIGEPRTRIWCDQCMTSGRYEVDILRLTADGVTVVATHARCLTCTENESHG